MLYGNFLNVESLTSELPRVFSFRFSLNVSCILQLEMIFLFVPIIFIPRLFLKEKEEKTCRLAVSWPDF